MADETNINLIASVDFAADTQSKLQRQLAQIERGLRLNSPIKNMISEGDAFSKTLTSVNTRVLSLGASFNALTSGC